jgi:hypothetical protein
LSLVHRYLSLVHRYLSLVHRYLQSWLAYKPQQPSLVPLVVVSPVSQSEKVFCGRFVQNAVISSGKLAMMVLMYLIMLIITFPFLE